MRELSIYEVEEVSASAGLIDFGGFSPVCPRSTGGQKQDSETRGTAKTHLRGDSLT